MDWPLGQELTSDIKNKLLLLIQSIIKLYSNSDTEIIERFQNKALKMRDILVVCYTRLQTDLHTLKAAAIRDEAYSFRLKLSILLGGKLNEVVKETFSRRFNLHLIDVLDLSNVNYTESLWIKIVQP